MRITEATTVGGAGVGGKMPGAIQELKIGPFSGGINTHSDKSAIADSEMVDCNNLDIDLDGSLLARPPWTLLRSDTLSTVASPTSPFSYQRILGTFVYGGNRVIFFQNVNATTPSSAQVYQYWLDGPQAGTRVALTGGIPNQNYTKAIRYEDKIYVVPAPDSALGGFSYDLTTVPATACVAIAGMPGGNSAVVYKFAMFIGGGKTTNRSRVFFSNLADPTTWPAANFFDIAPGDGYAVEDFLIYQDNILIAKDNSTYVLAYDASPLNAIVRLVNNTIGVKGPYCMVPYENSVFFLTYGQVYEMLNYNFTRVSTKIFSITQTLDQTLPAAGNPFNATWGPWPIFIATMGDRLVCRLYNTIYVYHLRVRAWTRWTSADVTVQYFGPPMEIDRTNTTTVLGFKSYVASTSLNITTDSAGPGSSASLSRYEKLLKFEDHFEGTFTENGQITPTPVPISSFVVTKVYDINLSHRFKRIMHWGVDMVSSGAVTGILFPFTIAYVPTWGQLSTYKWSQLNTWQYPLFTVPQTSTTVTPSGQTVISRRFIRFPKSLRFRMLQFQVSSSYSGNTTDGPVRVYTLTAFIGSKAIVPAAVN
jgi:hypothetical protein